MCMCDGACSEPQRLHQQHTRPHWPATPMRSDHGTCGQDLLEEAIADKLDRKDFPYVRFVVL